jgi:multidrug efflux system outer membrane protein
VQANSGFSGGKDASTQSTFNILGLIADATFQIGLWARLRRATEASRAELLATQDARDTITLTLVSDVASDYFQLLQLDLQLEITRDMI